MLTSSPRPVKPTLFIPLWQAGHFTKYGLVVMFLTKGRAMKDQTYALLAALFCVALAIAGIYYLTADTPIWNDWSNDAPSTTEAPSPSSGKQIDERIPPGENAPAVETSTGGDQAISKQAPGETVDIRPPEKDATPDSVAPTKPDSPASPASGKELTDRIPETDG